MNIRGRKNLRVHGFKNHSGKDLEEDLPKKIVSLWKTFCGLVYLLDLNLKRNFGEARMNPKIIQDVSMTFSWKNWNVEEFFYCIDWEIIAFELHLSSRSSVLLLVCITTQFEASGKLYRHENAIKTWHSKWRTVQSGMYSWYESELSCISRLLYKTIENGGEVATAVMKYSPLPYLQFLFKTTFQSAGCRRW